ncbi:hypothetical protein CAL14_06620 [Bordetella genomosp. 9]|uniref:hypothetical protein n=1 Tax=Bordetella genomosp. 9 TaxID=1416803 RepID=UPI000A292258|nr:hypothetical protein [Bordetella genomosp. 9]ARP90004.1 hypothetical protein CAL14_06620 [Bordetella genomosp. 9]
MNFAADQQFPTKWPFPPAPPARRGLKRLLSPAVQWFRGAPIGLPNHPGNLVNRAGFAHGALPAAAAPASDGTAIPLSAFPAGSAVASAPAAAPVSGVLASQAMTVRQMVVDVLLVAMWGAMIPALMWLGAAAGF